ncbi:MAG: M48 family metallopeptidase [Verrucomicrobiota bacterium]
MDFFEHQEQARRKSGVLLFYFFLAMLGIIAAVYGLVVVTSFFVEGSSRGEADLLGLIWRPGMLVTVVIATCVVIFSASGFKSAQLAGGGKVVARDLGGREIDTNTIDFHERRLLNVVEEMAIASGVPVPKVFVMDEEDSINAFAAGKTPSDAVVGVTRGCLTLLTRDEVQGVIAHEFSHILNGDMRLNMRLMGWLFGILFLVIVGEMILRVSFRGGFRSGRKEGAGLGIALLVGGAGLMLIGWVGNFFASLIKASISRQREYLADASAVQFTRNPDGIAGALAKIGGFSEHAEVKHPMAREASHLFFGSSRRSTLFATHPPLEDRIRRLLPSWRGEFGPAQLPEVGPSENDRDRKARPPALPVSMLASGSAPVAMTRSEAEESMRSVHPEQVALGRDIHSQLPQDWIDACHNLDGAEAILYSLLIDPKDSSYKHALTGVPDRVARVLSEKIDVTFTLHSAVKLALADLAIPTLRHLSPHGYAAFRDRFVALVHQDRQIDLFELSMMRAITRHLDSYFGEGRSPRIRFRKLSAIHDPASVLLTTLAVMGHTDDLEAARRAFDQANASLRSATGHSLEFLPADRCGLAQIETALDEIADSTPRLKQQFLLGCADCVLADDTVTSGEAELIRAIADALACPIPPLIRTAKLG